MVKRMFWFSVFVGAMVNAAFLPGADVTVPVTAKYRYVVTTVDPSGTETTELEAEGVYLRTSSGQSLSRHQPVRDGTKQPEGRGIYVDRRSGKTYLLDFGKKAAYLQSSSIVVSDDEYRKRARAHAVAEAVINGIPCLGFPVTGSGKGVKSVSGMGWKSLDYDLDVKTESEHLREDGSRIRYLREMYEIQLGVEPRAGTVEIPADFAIYGDPSQSQAPRSSP
jgi:hypothetical protein